MLEKRELGQSGIKVNPMGLGLWAMGGTTWGATDDKESINTIDQALELGVDFFDTADVYGDGHSEVLLGKAMKGRRDKFVVGTKIGWIDFDGEAKHSSYLTPEMLIKGVENNLKRLNTNYIDLLQWHVNFRDTTMESFLEGAQHLKDSGKIRAFGLSTSDYPYIQEFYSQGDASSLQIDYSILNRTAEKEIFPFTRQKQIGTIIRGGLAMGLLTGKFDADSEFSKGDFRESWKSDSDQHEQFLKDIAVVDQLKSAFPDQTLAQLALRFILSNSSVSIVIPGAKRIDQLKSNVASAELGLLSQDEMKRIDKIVSPGGGRKIWPA
ncbi:MAG: aldo/keto reductase [Spirochaetaceae bacterium]|jgi:aryl-alcohol dehydrogenase-like predicted oxidoreductase|nr:aldo/keto reductase [Spirochaetaceae bacterium]